MNNHKKIDWLRWHKEKSFIRFVCGLLVALLTIILLLMFPIVSDADEPTVGDYWHMEEILNYEDALTHNGDSNYYNVPSNIFSSPTFYGSKGDVFNYYDKLKSVFELPFSTFSGVQTNYNMTICKELNSDNLVIIFDGVSISLNYSSGTYSYVRPPSIYGGSPRYFIFDGSNIISSDYYSGGSYKDLTNCDYILFSSCNVNMYYPSYDQNLNYLKIEGKMGFGSGGFDVEDPSGIYPDGSGGDITNNMYMRTADWKFNIPKYWTNSSFVNSNPTDKWGSGNVQFYGLINDFQKDHASDYKLKFDYYLQLVGTYDGNTSFAHSYALRNVEYNLTDFLNNNNTYQVNVEYIFTNATDTGGNNIYTTLEDLRGGQISQVFFNKWTLSCSAHLISGNYTSGSIQETYDFLSQISKENSNTITDNNNPYYPPDSDVPDSDGSTSLTDKDGKIILTNYDNDNNNQVVNINSNDKTVVDTLVDKMVPDNVTGESGLTQRFVSLTNANAWFDVMESSLSIFPTEFWQTIYTIFIASLGILGVAFLLWILVHIL